MLPIKDSQPSYSAPVVTGMLIGLNVFIFLFMLTLDHFTRNDVIYAFGFVPAHFSWVTVVSSMFLHGGWMHLIGNMLFLWIFGDNLEDVMGHVKYLIFYLVTGAAAGLAQVLIDTGSTVPVVGASGAIACVMGGYILLFPNGLIRTLVMIGFFPFIFYIPAWLQIGAWIITQLLSGIFTLGVDTQFDQGGVAYFAHIGGFVAGLLLVRLFKNDQAYERQKLARMRHKAFERMQTRQLP
jgi:membrane associated rhomboid family serine protease